MQERCSKKERVGKESWGGGVRKKRWGGGQEKEVGGGRKKRWGVILR